MFNKLDRQKVISFIKYCFVGVNGTILDIGSLAILVEFFHINLGVSTAISFALAVVHNFIFNKWWTFQNSSTLIYHQYVKFFLVSIVGFIMTMLSMYIFVVYLDLWYISSKIFTSVFVLTWNFLANYNWTFKEDVVIPCPKIYLYKYSIIIPAYNESRRIKKTLKNVIDYFEYSKESVEIIVVDDGSRDLTYETVTSFLKEQVKNLSNIKYSGIRFDENHGKGRAVKVGVLKSYGEHVLYIDADGSTPISELKHLERYINDYDVIIGSRRDRETIIISQPAYRRIVGMFRKLSTFFLIKDIGDTQCGFKLMRSEVAYDLFNRMTINRFGFDIELLVLANARKYKVKEVSVLWSHIRNTNFRIFSDPFLSLKDVFFIYFNFLTGRYL